MSSARRFVTPVAALAVIVLLILQVPWSTFLGEGAAGFVPTGDVRSILTVTFWVLAIALIVLMFEARKDPGADAVEVEGPAFTRFLFSNTRAGLFWLPIRVFLGFEWLEAGWHKLTGTGWLDGGSALRGFWENIVKVPAAPARPPITFEWYRDFINYLLSMNAESWFSYLIVFGEIAVGVGLLLGVLTGVAAFFGATMNMSFELAGSASTNPIMFFFAVGLMLAWRVAGHYGLDRYLLPTLGVPWRAKVATVPPGAAPAPVG